MPYELYGLMALFSLQFQKYISSKIFLIVKANSFALLACQCKEASDNYGNNFDKNNKKGNLKLDGYMLSLKTWKFCHF